MAYAPDASLIAIVTSADTGVRRWLQLVLQARPADGARPAGGRRRSVRRPVGGVAGQAGPGEGRRRDALLVGGEPTQRRFCETLLQALGLRVTLASDAEQALRSLQRAEFGLVILDDATPGLDVGSWARLAGRVGGRDGPLVYLVSGEPEWAAPGAVRTLRRPVRALSLVEAVARLR